MAERKRYIDVTIPMLDSTMRILGTATDLHMKTIKLDLSRKLRGKGLTITFRVFNQDGKLVGVPNRMELVKSYIRRMTRKRTNYVEDSFTAHCSDVKVIMKPFLITRKRVSRVVRKNLRNTTREFLVEYVKGKSYNDICYELMEGILQKTLLPKLKKVYPLSFCDLRVFETKEIEKIDLEDALKTGVPIVEGSSEEDIQEVAEEVVEEKEEVIEAEIEEKEEGENQND
ncbi:hypothetical protein HOI04_01315 [archaeon]|nr:hypothetical protein [archaeon]